MVKTITNNKLVLSMLYVNNRLVQLLKSQLHFTESIIVVCCVLFMSSSMPGEGHCHDNDNILVDSICHAKRVLKMSPRKEVVVNNGNTNDWISR